MKKMVSKFAMLLMAVAFLAASFSSCKPKDEAIQKTITEALAANPEFAGAAVTVAKGVATINGEVKDPTVQAAIEAAVKGIKGVSSVTNSTTVPPPPAAPEITADDPLANSLKDAIKDNAGVAASVADGVVTLTGEISKSDLPKLLQKIMALSPKKVVKDGLTVK